MKDTTAPKYSTFADDFDTFATDIRENKPPILYSIGGGFERVKIGPKKVVVIGAPPGTGKTALVMQWTIDGMLIDPELRVLVCNVEMPKEDLLKRQLARLSTVDLNYILDGTLEARHRQNIEHGLEQLRKVADRVAVLHEPFTMPHVAAAADAHDADLIVLDYLQEISPGDENTGDVRQDIKKALSMARRFAMAGKAVIVVAATNRGDGNYEKLGIASFRDSSAFEYNADQAFILESTGPIGMTLHFVKSRNGTKDPLHFCFDGHYQRFRKGAA